MSVDALDYAIVKLFAEEPGVSVVEASRRLGVARITVQARLSRMHENGVIERIEPRLNPAAFATRSRRSPTSSSTRASATRWRSSRCDRSPR